MTQNRLGMEARVWERVFGMKNKKRHEGKGSALADRGYLALLPGPVIALVC